MTGVVFGKMVSWSSQAGGHAKVKTGVARCLLAANDDLKLAVESIVTGAKPSHVMGQRFSLIDRYLVEVRRPGKPSLWYTPSRNVVDKTFE